MTLLGKAIALAAEAHRDQVDRAGQAYILHPIRVMMRMDSDVEKMVAVLHDVVEDTDWTLEDLREAGFPDIVIEAVDGMTHREDETYTAYVKRASTNAIARKIKLADLEDNMNVRRVAHLTDEEVERLKRYHRHWLMLQGE